MLFMFYQTLQLRGWFDEDSLPERLHKILPGEYSLNKLNSSDGQTREIAISRHLEADEPGWLTIVLDSVVSLQVKVSDFEDEQVLVELFLQDSVGEYQRMEGCELLLADDADGKIAGGTIGDFCGLNAAATEYLVLKLQLDRPEISLQIESRRFDDQLLLKRDEYLLERLDPR